MFIIEGEESISEIDEVLSHASRLLQVDEYGNRMNWKKRETLLSSIDDLLDARLEKIKKPDAIEASSYSL